MTRFPATPFFLFKRAKHHFLEANCETSGGVSFQMTVKDENSFRLQVFFLSPIKKWLRPLGASFGGGHVEWFLMDPQEVVWSQWWGVNPGETLRCCIYFCGGWKLPQEKNGDYLWKPIFKDPYFSQSGMSQGFLITALFRLAFTWLLILGFFRNGWVIHHKNSQ